MMNIFPGAEIQRIPVRLYLTSKHTKQRKPTKGDWPRLVKRLIKKMCQLITINKLFQSINYNHIHQSKLQHNKLTETFLVL